MSQNGVYKTTTYLSAAAAAGAAAAYLTRNETMMQSFEELGYPNYFPQLLGVWKALGAAALATPWAPPLLKEWAYAGFTFTYTGAVVSHLARGEKAKSLAPLLSLALLGASYAARPVRQRP